MTDKQTILLIILLGIALALYESVDINSTDCQMVNQTHMECK